MFKNALKLVTVILSLAILLSFRLSYAGTGDNMSGWAWSSKIGWISFNCTTSPSGCDVLGDVGAGDEAGGLDGGAGGAGGGTGTGGAGTGGAFIKGALKKVVYGGIDNTKYIDPISSLKQTFSFLKKDKDLQLDKVFASGDLPGGGALGSSINYGVRVDTATGNISGWAWSDNVGWISFNESTGCPGGPCSPNMDMTTGYWSGWARAVAGTEVSDDGWDGWISLSCKNTSFLCLGSSYRVQYNPLTGIISETNRFAWGADVIGWVNFFGVNLDISQVVVSLTASPSVVMEGDSTNLTWWSNYATSCTATSSDGLWTGSKPLDNAVGEMVIPSGDLALLGADGLMHYYTKYTLTCSDGGAESVSSEALVEVSNIIGGDLVLQATPTMASPDNGFKVKLTWSSPSETNMTACFGNATNVTGSPILGTGWDGAKTSLTVTNSYTASTPGETIFVPQNPTRFNITCTNGATGLPISTFVDVTRGTLTPSVILSASGVSGSPGSYTADLSWTTSNLSSCTASNEDGITAWNGSKSGTDGTHSQDNVPVDDDATTYTLECTGPYGEASDSITVVPDECSPGETGCEIVGPWVGLTYANFIHDTLVGTVKLIWQTQDLTSCTASSTEPTSGWSGTVTASPNGVYSMSGIGWTGPVDTYTIECVGDDGSAVSDSLTLDMLTPTNPAPITPIYEEF